MNSQGENIMVLQSDLSGLLLYLRMKVAKQNPPFLGAVAFFMEMFWSIVSKKTWQSWEGGVLRKKLLLSQKQRTKNQDGVQFTQAKLYKNYSELLSAVQAMVSFLGASIQWHAAISPEVVPSAFSCWVCAFGMRCQRGESEGRKANVRASFGVRTQVYSLIVNKQLFDLEIRGSLELFTKDHLLKKQVGF